MGRAQINKYIDLIYWIHCSYIWIEWWSCKFTSDF